MRILFYGDTVFGFGGVQRVLAEIVRTLSQRHEITVLTTDHTEDLSGYGYDKLSVCFEHISYAGAPFAEQWFCRGYGLLYKYLLPSVGVASIIYAKSFFLPTYRRKLAEKINAGAYDVVIGVHAYPSLHLVSIKDRIHAETIGWMHNSYEAFFEKEDPYLPRLKGFFRYGAAKLDKVVVLSEADRKKYKERLGVESVVIHNPLSVEVKGKADLEKKRFLSVGRFSKGHKGFDLLIEAFARFAGTNTDWMLDMVGEGPEEERLRSQIRKNGLEDRIRIHPFTKDIHRYYSRSSVYVLASRWEGMPLVLVEAMAYGLPVIASDIPVVTELLAEKGMAVLFETGNVCRLAECLEYMAAEADLVSMSEKATAYAGNFGMEKTIARWERILN